MKLLRSFLWLLVILPAFIFSSCEKQPDVEQEGTLELGIVLDQLQGQLKSALEDSSKVGTHSVVISIVNADGELVMDNERLELYNFGGYWVTKEIKLKTGIYELIKFFVVDPEGNVRLAAPLEGSPKAYLVNHPLPLPFEIMKEQVTRVVPEVLLVVEDPPEAFGYVTFSYSVVKTLDFFIAVYIDDPRIMAPTRWTDAKLTVILDSVWRHSFKLEPRINKVTVRDGYWQYLLVVEKEGFMPVKMRISRDELFKTSPENPLLVGLPMGNVHLLVLQPGPEEGKDAMISMSLPEENFGDYPYFQAMADLPYSSVEQHKLSRSLVEWDLNQLPKSAVIKKAILTLYYPYNIYPDTIPFFDAAGNQHTGIDSSEIPYELKYAAVLQRVISPWEEHEVTWKNQPETTEKNQVFIPRKYYILYDYDCVNCFVPPVKEVIDITALLTETDNTGQYGLLMKLVNEDNFEMFRFASSDFNLHISTDPGLNTLWPKLEIYYTLPL
ncbi:MAG: hypothetical protein ISS19_16210 [Bacteroidales bacterium]|nr:hypothetical protein [Bacteroidales bacterium]